MKTKLKSWNDDVNYFFASDEAAATTKTVETPKAVKNPARMKLARQKIEGIPMFTTVRADNFELVAAY